jgi:hypothetical protein
MSLEAFEPMRYGAVGDAVVAAEPYTEADPVGIYAAVLSLWSAAINGPVRMYDDRPVVVWTVLVGESAIGRKGTAKGVASKMLAHSIGAFLDSRTTGGVSSGPSLTQLLWEKQEETEGAEGGVDTRLVVVDEEWSENLQRQNRCPTFASKLRSCWDGATIRNTTTKSVLTVHEPRLGFHAHITPAEWSEFIKPRHAKGGSYNRLLPVSVEGSKVLPYNNKERYPEIAGLAEAYQWARTKTRRMTLDAAAGGRYDEIRGLFLNKLAEMPDYLRCYVERTPEQVLRVAAALTATECSTTISLAAVNAAWAFVQYSVKSTETLVRASIEKSPARPTKSLPELIREVMHRYGGEVKHSDMLRALGVRATAHSLKTALTGMDDIQIVTGVSETGKGRPGTVYRWVTEGDDEPAAAEPTPVIPEPRSASPTAPPGEPRELTLSGAWL